jgi:hypothetical protein
MMGQKLNPQKSLCMLPGNYLSSKTIKMKHEEESGSLTLRQKAEELMKKKPLTNTRQFTESETMVIIHELQVHQIELEMQNEELLVAKEESEVARGKYTQLYDFAPSGYLTLSSEGEIIELNLCASQMLEKERIYLQNSRFGFFVSEDTKPIFNLFLGKVFYSKSKQSCEVTLNGIISELPDQCLITMMDITERKLAEKELARKVSELEIYYQLAITRERKMIALKSEINLLLERLGEKLKY